MRSSAMCFMWIAATAAIGCTNDFSSFRFAMNAASDPGDAGARDAGSRAGSGNDAGSSRFDAAADSGGMDATAGTGMRFDAASDAEVTRTVDASIGQHPDAANEAGAHPDAGSDTATHDAATHDAATHSDEDAGDRDAAPATPSDVDRCVSDWNARMLAMSCASCACGQCTSPVLDCLARGGAGENALCGDLLACALANHCHDWDCYCSSAECRGGQAADGPCVAEMEAAAGGGHNQVLAVHQANDPNQPLVRAVRAIGCTTGQSRGAVGGMMTGKCVNACTN